MDFSKKIYHQLTFALLSILTLKACNNGNQGIIEVANKQAAKNESIPEQHHNDNFNGTQDPNLNPNAPIINLGSLAFGGQTNSFANSQKMLEIGMSWVKFQHKWSPGQGGQDLAGRISDAKAKGFKVLMSIPGQPRSSSIDYGQYLSFIEQVAKLTPAPDAIEVWNEPNLDFEWPKGQISPENYVNQMLKPAYAKIKAANSAIIVISAAPAPTGYFSGCSANGCDDKFYVERMAAAGAAQALDCIGVHYNEGIISPKRNDGDPRGTHYTRYFNGMINTYHAAFGGSKPVCFTELGFVTAQGFSEGLPPGFSWAANTTVADQALWHADAVELAKSNSKVKMIIIFNVDFDYYSAEDPQAGFAIIRKDNSCLACEKIKAITR